MQSISITQLGHFKREIDIRFLKKWKSNLFKITACSTVDDILNINSSEQYWQALSDGHLCNILKPVKDSITFAITEYSLENNYYMRRINDGLVVISMFEIGDLLRSANIPLENYILKNIYEIVALSHLYVPLPKTRDIIPEIIHDETRRCLFDMHGLKTDIVHSLERLSLCQQCIAKLSENQLPDGFLNNLQVEIKKLRKPLFYRISDFIKKHPLWSIIIGLLASLFVNILANYLYDLLF